MLVASVLALAAVSAVAAISAGDDDDRGGEALPRGEAGIAAEHPGDRAIGSDPRVLLAESFEEGEIADLGKRWTSVKNPKGRALAFIDDAPAGAHGRRSLQITATLDQDTGGHLYTPLPSPVDRVFARFYVRFPEGASYTHHFVHLGGYRPVTPWPQGGAGERPAGDERMTVGIEPFGDWGRQPAPGAWGFYSYWHEMVASPDGKFWGNVHRPRKPRPVPAGRWQCVEVMLALNSFDEAGAPRRDGELALWLDGDPVLHVRPGARGRTVGKGGITEVAAPDAGGEGGDDDGLEALEGIAWRKSPELQIDFFWLLYYVTEGALDRMKVREKPATQSVRFDDIVVATEYVGPITGPR